MSTNPYQAPPPVDVVGINSGQREDLRKVAQYQKGILYCILANIILYFANFAVAQQGVPAVSMVIIGLYVLVGLTQLVLLVLLSLQVYNVAVGIVAGVLAFIPCLGLLVLLIVNQKATKVLQANGIKVGLMGANMAQLP